MFSKTLLLNRFSLAARLAFLAVMVFMVQGCGPSAQPPASFTEAPTLAATLMPTSPAAQAATATQTAVPSLPPPSETAAPPTQPEPSTGTATTTQPVSSTVSGANPLIHIQMLDAQTGWGSTAQQQIVRTTDGGRTWSDVTPPEMTGQPPTTNFFLDKEHAWVVASDPQDMMAGSQYITTNGGQTWTSSSVPFGLGYLQFIDLNEGWMLAGRGAAAGSSAVDIYHTPDSGKSWEKTFGIDPTTSDSPGSLPFAGDKSGLTFIDNQHGWVTGSEPKDGYAWLFFTEDGGKTWQHQDLPLPPQYANSILSIDPPHFFSNQEGVLPVTAFSQTGDRIFFTTQDAGKTWQPTTPVPINGAISTASMQDFFVWDGETFYASQDGGLTWNKLTPNLNLSQTIVQLDMLDATTGWVISMDANQQGQLYQTTDGGQTWIQP